jgi:hypothetical protein
VYVFSFFTVFNENTLTLRPIKFPVKHTKLSHISHLVLERNVVSCNINGISRNELCIKLVKLLKF